jgi:hypothetical protein
MSIEPPQIMPLFTVVERRTISEELAQAADRWLARTGLPERTDETWLELVCEDGDVFRPDQVMLHLAVPPCEVSAGASVDVGRTQTVAQLWPGGEAPADAVPKHLALALTFERRDEVWVGVCELPGPVLELFTVEHPQAMLAVMNATRRTLNRGAMNISGDPGGRLAFTMVEDSLVAFGSTEAAVAEPFTYWLDGGPASVLATPLTDATRVVGSLGGLDDLIFANEQGVQARCPLNGEGPAPEALAEDYFEKHAQGRVEGLRVDRQGGLGREALAAIANLRPGEVTFAVADDGSLVISGGRDDDAVKIEGPGFEAMEDLGSASVVVPYPVALAIYDGAVGGTVDLTIDAQWGRLRRADQGITVEWRR